MSGPARWAASAQDRVNAFVARLPSSPGDLVASAVGFAVAAVLVAGVLGGTPGRAQGPGGPHGARATVGASSAGSRGLASNGAPRSPHGDAAATGAVSRSAAGTSETSALPVLGGSTQNEVQQVASDTVGAAGQVVHSATDAVKKVASGVTKTVSGTVDTATNTVSSTLNQGTSVLP